MFRSLDGSGALAPLSVLAMVSMEEKMAKTNERIGQLEAQMSDLESLKEEFGEALKRKLARHSA